MLVNPETLKAHPEVLAPGTTPHCRLLKAPLSINIGAYINTYTTLGVPYYMYSIVGPQTLF